MKVKFLRDYHGPETNEFRHLEGAEVVLSDVVAEDFIKRRIVISIEPEPIKEPVIESEPEQVEAQSVLEPKVGRPKRKH